MIELPVSRVRTAAPDKTSISGTVTAPAKQAAEVPARRCMSPQFSEWRFWRWARHWLLFLISLAVCAVLVPASPVLLPITGDGIRFGLLNKMRIGLSPRYIWLFKQPFVRK